MMTHTELKNSSAFYEILNYIPQADRVKLQGLNKRFYKRMLPEGLYVQKGKWETVETEKLSKNMGWYRFTKSFSVSSFAETKPNMKIISRFIEMSEFIIRLDLSNSRIDDHGVQLICDGISRKNRSIKDLSLKRVGLTVGGLYRVGEMIAYNKTVERLSVGEDN